MQADIGVVGLGVMGRSLVLNFAEHDITVKAYEYYQHDAITEWFAHNAQSGRISAATSLTELVAGLKTPRKVLLMVRAGEVVDDYLKRLIPLLDSGDIVIDGGNSHFADTDRRVQWLKEHGLHFVGCGISGGEEGARHGPSIMPGGDRAAWPAVQPLLQAIAAKTAKGEVCCDWVGDGGAGHFVKMVHNGIEYGDMQLIGEAYDFMRQGLALDGQTIAVTFQRWQQGMLSSYLMEITAAICAQRDRDGDLLLDHILDTAGQKGTGKWTLINAMETGTPLTLIGEAVQARFISALHTERQQLAATFDDWLPTRIEGGAEEWLDQLAQALRAAKIISYAQGFMLMQAMSAQRGWQIDLGAVALLWRAGCIIRSDLLDDIHAAYADDPTLHFLGAASPFKQHLHQAQAAWRNIVAAATIAGITLPCISAGLTFMDGITRTRLPANLLQAQRDYFGAHTYERTDQPRGSYFHYDWSGQGGERPAHSYSA